MLWISVAFLATCTITTLVLQHICDVDLDQEYFDLDGIEKTLRVVSS